MEFANKATAGVRKPKKKQVKDEFDRIKQAEKKRRRLEKALATSAAIRSELEKKKLKKKEEQERLDEEGAAIAEAVALHVLLGEDSDDSKKKYVRGNGSGISSSHQYEQMWSFCGNSNLMASAGNLGSSFYPRYLGQGVRSYVGSSAGNLAAQAVSSLKITDDTFVFNPFVRG